MARRLFVRVRDNSTGHEFDVYEDDPRIGRVVTHVKPVRYPPAHVARPPKYNILAGRPAMQEQSAPTGADQATSNEENH